MKPITKSKFRTFFVLPALVWMFFIGNAGWAAVAIGQGELAVDAVMTGAYDSNIYANSTQEHDYIGSFTPGLKYMQASGIVNVAAYAGVNITRFSDHSENDFEDFKTRLQASFPHREDTQWLDYFNAAYDQNSQASPYVGNREKINNWTLGDDFTYQYSDKFAFRLSPDYLNSRTKTPGLWNRQIVTIPVRFLYHYSSKLDFDAGYRFRDTNVAQHGLDSQDNELFIGATGLLLPKVTGTIEAGAQSRNYKNGQLQDSTSPSMSVDLKWDTQSKLVVNFIASRDFYTTENDLSESFTDLKINCAYGFTDKISASFGGELAWEKYNSNDKINLDAAPAHRTDTVYRINGGMNYNINKYCAAYCNAYYENRDSSYFYTKYDHVYCEIGIRFTY